MFVPSQVTVSLHLAPTAGRAFLLGSSDFSQHACPKESCVFNHMIPCSTMAGSCVPTALPGCQRCPWPLPVTRTEPSQPSPEVTVAWGSFLLGSRRLCALPGSKLCHGPCPDSPSYSGQRDRHDLPPSLECPNCNPLTSNTAQAQLKPGSPVTFPKPRPLLSEPRPPRVRSPAHLWPGGFWELFPRGPAPHRGVP